MRTALATCCAGNPIIGIAACCACTANGHADAGCVAARRDVGRLMETPRANWNDWFAAGFRNFAAIERKWVSQRLEVFAAMIGEETAKVDSKLYAEIKTLKSPILRAEIEILRAHKVSRPDVNLAGVVPLRGRDVA